MGANTIPILPIVSALPSWAQGSSTKVRGKDCNDDTIYDNNLLKPSRSIVLLKYRSSGPFNATQQTAIESDEDADLFNCLEDKLLCFKKSEVEEIEK